MSSTFDLTIAPLESLASCVDDAQLQPGTAESDWRLTRWFSNDHTNKLTYRIIVKKLAVGCSAGVRVLTELGEMQPDNPIKPGAEMRPARKSILYVIVSLDIGGTEHHLTQITPRLKSLGWQPIVYCLEHRGSLAGDLERHGVEVIAPPLQSLRGLGRYPHLLLSALYLLSLMLRRRPTIVHFFLPQSYLVGAPLAIMARIPIRVMSRRSQNLYQLKRPFARMIEPRLHRRMQALFGNSKAVVRDLVAEGAPSERVTLLYNGIDTASIPAIIGIEPAPLSAHSLKLILVANLIPYKGHSDLFQALAQIAPQLPPDWTLLCVGRDTGIGGELASLARELKLAPHIQFLGERRDVLQLLASADIGLLCSHEEGFSNAVLEGMAAGLPMVVTDVGGNPEAVVHEKTGLVVPPRDPSALGRAILRLAGDGAARATMGEAARGRARAEFSIERCIENYDRVYRELVYKRNQP